MVTAGKCPNCNRENAMDAKFCSYCGTSLTNEVVVCRNPECKRTNPPIPGAHYCAFCGRSLVAREDIKWVGEVLNVAPDVDFEPLLKELYVDEPVPQTARDLVRETIENIRPISRQRLIRKFGLDGKKPRTTREIAQESGRNLTTVTAGLESALSNLRNALYKKGVRIERPPVKVGV